MVRSSLEADSAHVLINVFPNGGMELGCRESAGAVMAAENPGTVALGTARLRIVRAGDGITAYYAKGDGQEWVEHVRRLVAKKSDKLRRHKEGGRETWLVFYNTFWTVMNPSDVRDGVLAALGPQHDHIDHVGVVSGNPPDDAWLDTVR